MKYYYMLNTLQLKEWLKTHEYLCEGPLGFEVKGIRIMIPKGADAWDKAGFSIKGDDGEPIFLPLLHREIVFIVHRDMYQKEWIAGIEDGPSASQDQIFE
jgi:hypothetical protein